MNTWTATAEAINALPDPIRHYIHQLETRTDPAGDVRRIAELKDACDGMETMYRLSQAMFAAAVTAAGGRIEIHPEHLAAENTLQVHHHVASDKGNYIEVLAVPKADAMMKARDQ